MGRINLGRTILGGLAAGVVVNVGEVVLNAGILSDTLTRILAETGLKEGPFAVPAYVLSGFLVGVGGVWLYAAVRPRFGPGPRTAVYAALAVWILVWGTLFLSNLSLPLYPGAAMLFMVLWGLVECLVAVLAGAWLYREEGSAPAGAGSSAS